MGKRKLPFGYEMKCGNILLQSEEAACVRILFDQYQQGASFKTLTELMQNKGVFYDEGKLWNKNMIARILKDKCYTGKAPYPAIIDVGQFQAVEAVRYRKQAKIEKTEAQKQLRKLCGAKITPKIEQQALCLLNRLIEKPEIVQSPVEPTRRSYETAMLQKKLDDALIKQPIAEDVAIQMVYELASAEYDTIGSAEYETERIQRLLLKSELMDKLNEVLLQKCVSRVIVDNNGIVGLELKNYQLIEWSV